MSRSAHVFLFLHNKLVSPELKDRFVFSQVYLTALTYNMNVKQQSQFAIISYTSVQKCILIQPGNVLFVDFLLVCDMQLSGVITPPLLSKKALSEEKQHFYVLKRCQFGRFA